MSCREEGSVPPVEVKVRGSFGARGRHLGTAVRRKNQGPVSPYNCARAGVCFANGHTNPCQLGSRRAATAKRHGIDVHGTYTASL